MSEQINNIKKIIKLLESPLFLDIFGKQSENKKRLILGTMMQESRFIYRRQFNDGPARGLGQIEPNTAYDIFKNYLNYRHDMLRKVLKTTNQGFNCMSKKSLETELEKNDLFNLVMLRMCYYRVPKAVPSSDLEIAKYWKKYYNTELGAGTTEEFLHSLKKLDKITSTI